MREFSANDLCYDLADARIVYRPARKYMPSVDGLKAENVSLRHNRIVPGGPNLTDPPIFRDTVYFSILDEENNGIPGVSNLPA